MAVYFNFVHSPIYLYRNHSVSDIGSVPAFGRKDMKKFLLCLAAVVPWSRVIHKLLFYTDNMLNKFVILRRRTRI
jgi:hypothetical protein